MNASRAWFGATLALGGALVICGALLPWLTLFAGLQSYAGTIGLYGRLMLAAGLTAFTLGIVSLRIVLRWLPWAASILGAAVIVFAFWLLAGTNQIVHRPDNIMFVARPGSGLFVILTGALLIVAASALGHIDNRLRVVQDSVSL